MKSTDAERLVTAASNGDARRVERLLAGGADPNASSRGSTPLYGAAMANHGGIVRALLAAGADPNAESRGEGEGLPLCAAACWGLDDAVAALLEGGADPNLREDDGEGNTPLDWATNDGHLTTIRLLLAAGAEPNDATSWGLTPLHRAARRGSPPAVRALLAAGAKPDVATDDGRTPLDEAEEWVGKDVEDELRRRLVSWDEPDARFHVSRRRSGESEIVEVSAETPEFKMSREIETGHAEIVALLRDALRPRRRSGRRRG